MKICFYILLGFFWISNSMMAQELTNKNGSSIRFTPVAQAKSTSVKNQNQSSTCWSFSTQSFIESELIRMGKDPVDLSEMYIVRMAYEEKAIRFVRLMGAGQFSPGGEPHDVMKMISKYGLVPESVYPVLDEKINHSELDAVLKGYLDQVIKLNHNHGLSNHWLDGFKGILDAYLGKIPESFIYNGKKFTPVGFAQYLGINPDDYVEITSFNHHPFYTQFVLEVPDNWDAGTAYNVELEDLKNIAMNALKNGYTIEWASDVSEKGFDFKKGLAIVPAKPWSELRDSEKDSLFNYTSVEMSINATNRQQAFDNLTTQDDHGMHLTGLVQDQTGKYYFIVKNSWGTSHNDNSGLFYCSENYFLYKTTAIMVHKQAIPVAVRKKLGLG